MGLFGLNVATSFDSQMGVVNLDMSRVQVTSNLNKRRVNETSIESKHFIDAEDVKAAFKTSRNTICLNISQVAPLCTLQSVPG